MAKSKPKPRAIDRPHHDIVFKLSTNGIEIRDCSLQIGIVPQLLVRNRDVIWWLIVHRTEPDSVWDRDLIGHIATTRYNVGIVADGAGALRVLQQRQCLSPRQKHMLSTLLFKDTETFTQRQVAEVLSGTYTEKQI